MNINLPYFANVAISIIVFYLAYLLLFSKEKMFMFNRIYLITSMLVSFIIPLITFTEQIVMPATAGITDIGTATTSNIPTALPPQTIFGLTLHQLPALLFISGFIFFLTVLIIGHIKALMIIKKSSNQILYGCHVKVTQKDIPPFTYFNKLIIPSKIINTTHIKSVLHHENIHKEEWHCIDILLMEIMFLFQWFNPFAWLMKKAVRDNLEFLTDEKVTEFIDKQEYQLGIISLAGKTTFNNFPALSNQSQLKKRIIMMAKNKQSKFQWVKMLVIIPMLTIMTFTLSGREVQVIYPETQMEEITITEEKVIKGSVTDNNSNYKTTESNTSKPNKIEGENINGVVTDENGKPIAGVSVTVKGSTIGTITDMEGNFILKNITNTVVLSFAMIDYEKKDMPLKIFSKSKTGDNTNQETYHTKVNMISVQLEKSASSTASENETANSAEYTTCSDDANSLPFRIRTKDAMNTPILIVDGEKYAPGEFDTKQLDPDDIESISVIKDNTAIEKYGDEGKNGVVIIKIKNKF